MAAPVGEVRGRSREDDPVQAYRSVMLELEEGITTGFQV